MKSAAAYLGVDVLMCQLRESLEDRMTQKLLYFRIVRFFCQRMKTRIGYVSLELLNILRVLQMLREALKTKFITLIYSG